MKRILEMADDPNFKITAEMMDAAFPTSRTCGDCTLCCTTHEVFEMNKPANLPCPMLCSKGCGIYGQHPETCKGYVCLWRASNGIIPRDWQPHVVGFVPSWDPGHSPHLLTVHLDPARKDAWRDVKYLRHFATLAHNLNMVVVFGGGTEGIAFLAPNGMFVEKDDAPELFQGSAIGCPTNWFRDDAPDVLMPLPGFCPNFTGEPDE